MTELFLKIVNMSITASWLVLAVLVLRLILKKAPKWIRVLLWGIVGIRLLCPFSIESTLSLIPSTQIIPEQVLSGSSFNIHTGIAPVDNPLNDYLDKQYFEGISVSTSNNLHIMTILVTIWSIGILLLLCYTIISYWRLHRKIDTAILLRDNIFQSEYVTSPFVLGIVKPKIYLSFNMDSHNLEYVVSHEQAHIRRRDHWWKPLGFLLLTLHWFNPFMWLSYVLLCRDIELACDEKVIKELTMEQKADYSQALLNCSSNHKTIAACPLSFGEVSVKDRVKSVLNYKKPAFWMVAIAVIACAMIALCFLTNPTKQHDSFAWVQKLSKTALLDTDLTAFIPFTEREYEQLTQNADIPEQDLLDTAISTAVLEHYASDKPDNLLHVESHVLLDNEFMNDTPQMNQESSPKIITVYLLVLQQKYSISDNTLMVQSGSYIPTAITFSISEMREYTLKEYWEPRDGSYYADDIRDKFPGTAADKALNAQAYTDELEAQCDEQALAWLNSGNATQK